MINERQLGYDIDSLNLHAPSFGGQPSAQNAFSEGVSPTVLGSGELVQSVEIAKTGLFRSGQTDYNTGTGWWLGNDDGTPKFSIGDSTGARITWDGTALTISGVSKTLKQFTAAENITAGNAVSAGLYAADGGILLDAKATGSGTGTTLATGVSFTVGSNSNRVLIVFVNGANNTDAAGASVAATYNGVAMTALNSDAATSDSGQKSSFKSFILVAPATGSNTLAFQNLVTTSNFGYSVHSYYNVKQTGQPHANAGDTVQRGNDGSGNDLSISVTSTVEGCLTVGYGSSDQTFFNTSGSGGDTGIMIPKGVYNMTYVTGTGGTANGALVCIEPFTTPTAAIVKASAKNRNVTDYWATTNYKQKAFIGFADEAITAGTTGDVVISGEATGLSSLLLGEQYYLSDTYGAISTTAGTNTRKAAIGTSTTTALITNIW